MLLLLKCMNSLFVSLRKKKSFEFQYKKKAVLFLYFAKFVVVADSEEKLMIRYILIL